MNTDACTDFLVPTSSFIVGMGTCLNIAGTNYSYNVSDTPQEADALAIQSDWEVIGKDLLRVIESFPPRKLMKMVLNFRRTE